MAFCGQCGLLQPPNVTTCPRCGMAVTPAGESEGQNAHDATIISATMDKTEQSQNTPFPRYYTQNSVPPPPPGYRPQSGREFSTTQGGSNPGTAFPTGPSTSPSSIWPQKKRNGLVTLLILLLVVTTLGIATVAFVIGPDRILQVVTGSGNTLRSQQAIAPTPQVSTPTPVSPTPTLTPEQQAQAVIDRYYTAINNKDYQTAYNLWVNYPASEQDFANGFANTQRDDHQFGQVITQNDGTIQVYITLVATSTSYQQTTFQGYYTLGQQSDGSWKISKAKMNKV